jgi:hypothetical protein
MSGGRTLPHYSVIPSYAPPHADRLAPIRNAGPDDDGLPKARPIALSDSPRLQRSHNSVFSAAVNPLYEISGSSMHIPSLLQDKVLRRQAETTGWHLGRTSLRCERGIGVIQAPEPEVSNHEI